MKTIMTDSEMTEAVDKVLSALNLGRESFSDQRDAVILFQLSQQFGKRGSVAASIVTAHAADMVRQIEGMALKVCTRCGREFWIDGYLAPKRAFSRCGRLDCEEIPQRGREGRDGSVSTLSTCPDSF